MGRWIKQIWDPRFTWEALSSLPWFFRALSSYRKLPSEEDGPPIYLSPQLHDRSSVSSIERHYFYLNGWALRKIVNAAPTVHIDIGSQVGFANSVAASLPTVFLDIRPLFDRMDGLVPVAGDILICPIRDASVPSLSCLHVLEHVGLGRYGDDLDPNGSRKGAKELVRILAPGGDLYLGLPIGKPAEYFNAHRVHSPEVVIDYFADLELVTFAAVDDAGLFTEAAEPPHFSNSDYACGMYHFRKPV